MSDLIHRSQKVKMLIADPSLPKWQRLDRGLEALSGLELSDLPEDVTQPLEAHLVSINQVLARYTLDVADDYQTIAEVDLNRMLDTLDRATAQAIAAELDRIVAELDEGHNKLPEQALREAREHRDLMIPRLIEILQATLFGMVGVLRRFGTGEAGATDDDWRRSDSALSCFATCLHGHHGAL